VASSWMDNVVRNLEFRVEFTFLIVVTPLQAYHFLDMPWDSSNPLLNKVLRGLFLVLDLGFLYKLVDRNCASPYRPPLHPALGWLNHIEV
jgi:hypothetical protein